MTADWSPRHVPLPLPDLQPERTRDVIRAELAEVNETINKAYWAFTRTAKGKPPILVCPEAYKRRQQLMQELRKCDR
jgi:hypothetical protein